MVDEQTNAGQVALLALAGLLVVGWGAATATHKVKVARARRAASLREGEKLGFKLGVDAMVQQNTRLALESMAELEIELAAAELHDVDIPRGKLDRFYGRIEGLLDEAESRDDQWGARSLEAAMQAAAKWAELKHRVEAHQALRHEKRGGKKAAKEAALVGVMQEFMRHAASGQYLDLRDLAREHRLRPAVVEEIARAEARRDEEFEVVDLFGTMALRKS